MAPSPTSTPAPPDTTHDLAVTLSLVIGRLNRQVRDRSTSGLSQSQLSALVSIEQHGPVRLGHLAKLEGISPPTTTTLVGILLDKGLIERRADANDGRSSVVVLTRRGRSALASVRTAKTANLDRRLAGLEPHERQAIHDALGALAKLLDEPGAVLG